MGRPKGTEAQRDVAGLRVGEVLSSSLSLGDRLQECVTKTTSLTSHDKPDFILDAAFSHEYQNIDLKKDGKKERRIGYTARLMRK